MAKKKNAKNFTECTLKGKTYIIRCNPKGKTIKVTKYHPTLRQRVEFKTKK